MPTTFVKSHLLVPWFLTQQFASADFLRRGELILAVWGTCCFLMNKGTATPRKRTSELLFSAYKKGSKMNKLLLLLTILGHVGAFRPMVRYTATLPVTMTDSVVNPETGDFAAISSVTKQVYVFHRDSLLANTTETPDFNITLQSAPTHIAFKRYQNRSYYVIACEKEANIYLVSADGLSLRVVGKHPIDDAASSMGASSVFSSLNAEDPFLYYSYMKSGTNSLFALNLRTKQSALLVDLQPHYRPRSEGGAISADGQVLYIAPDSLISYSMSTDWTAASPRFVQINNEGFYSYSRTPFFPDPFSKYVARDKAIYTKGINHGPVATLDFQPHCFAASQPLVFGFRQPDGSNYLSMQVVAVAYDIFELVGQNLTIPAYMHSD